MSMLKFLKNPISMVFVLNVIISILVGSNFSQKNVFPVFMWKLYTINSSANIYDLIFTKENENNPVFFSNSLQYEKSAPWYLVQRLGRCIEKSKACRNEINLVLKSQLNNQFYDKVFLIKWKPEEFNYHMIKSEKSPEYEVLVEI